MEDTQGRPPLTSLHSDALLSQPKLDKFRRLDTRDLVGSLRAGLPGSLKTRPDGTILDGHHRIAVLRERQIDVDALPREVLAKQQTDEGDKR